MAGRQAEIYIKTNSITGLFTKLFSSKNFIDIRFRPKMQTIIISPEIIKDIYYLYIRNEILIY